MFKNCYWDTKSHETMRFSNESHPNSFPLFLCFWDWFFCPSPLKWLRDHRDYGSTSLKGEAAKSAIIKSGCMKIIQELVGRSHCLCCKWAVLASIKNLFPSSDVPNYKKEKGIGNSNKRSKENSKTVLKDWKKASKTKDTSVHHGHFSFSCSLLNQTKSF